MGQHTACQHNHQVIVPQLMASQAGSSNIFTLTIVGLVRTPAVTFYYREYLFLRKFTFHDSLPVRLLLLHFFRGASLLYTLLLYYRKCCKRSCSLGLQTTHCSLWWPDQVSHWWRLGSENALVKQIKTCCLLTQIPPLETGNHAVFTFPLFL